MKFAVLFLTLAQSTYGSIFDGHQTLAGLKDVCPGDVAFLVETSEQVTQNGVNVVADRILHVASSLNPAVLNNTKNTHVALTRFSNPDYQQTFTYDFDWGSNMTNVTDTLKNLVNEWDAIKGLSDLGYGLYQVSKLFTDEGYGRRSGVPGVLVIFAQGYQDSDDYVPHYPPPWNDPSRWPNPQAQAANLHHLGVKIYAVAVPPNPGSPTAPSTKKIGNQFTLMREVLVNLTGGHRDHVVDFDDYNMIAPKINALLASTKDCIIEPPTECHYLDLLFIVDESQSVVGAFEDIKRFLNNFVDSLGDNYVSQTYIRTALIGFAYDPFIEFYLNDIDNITIYKTKINSLRGRNGLTYTEKAFDMARDNVLKVIKGFRPDSVPSAIIFITDGNYDGADPAIPAHEIRDYYGTKIMSVAVEGEDSIDMNKLIEISGTKDNVFKINNYANLTTIVNDLMKKSCKRTGTKPTTQTTPTTGTTLPPGTCGKYDVAVLMDVSGTLRANMDQQKQFVNDVFDPSHGIKIDQTSGTRVGVVTVSSSATFLEGLAGYQNYDALKAGVNGIKNYGLIGYNLAEALGDQGAIAANGMFGTSEDRPDAPDITVVFVGEQPMDMGAAVTAAKILQDPPTNAKIIMVFAPGVDKNTFSGIHSDAQFQLVNWETNTISAMATQVAAKLCDIY